MKQPYVHVHFSPLGPPSHLLRTQPLQVPAEPRAERRVLCCRFPSALPHQGWKWTFSGNKDFVKHSCLHLHAQVKQNNVTMFQRVLRCNIQSQTQMKWLSTHACINEKLHTVCVCLYRRRFSCIAFPSVTHELTWKTWPNIFLPYFSWFCLDWKFHGFCLAYNSNK